MDKPNVYYYPVNKSSVKNVAFISRKILEKLIKDEKITLGKEIPLKIHPGEPGNISFIKPGNFSQIITYLLEKKIKTYFIETNTITGQRTNATSHKKVAKKHGFTQIPFVVADGEDGKDETDVKVENCKYFDTCKIGKKLANQSQIIVLNHFKGHIMAGFGAAIKMLGIGFASRQGKIEVHSKVYTPKQKTINWEESKKLYDNQVFIERMTEYALAAVNKNKYLYLTYALSIVENCDCDAKEMIPVYKDLGILASTDPVAIDKAVFDMLTKREGKKPFFGDEVFSYAQKIRLGSPNYKLVKLT